MLIRNSAPNLFWFFMFDYLTPNSVQNFNTPVWFPHPSSQPRSWWPPSAVSWGVRWPGPRRSSPRTLHCPSAIPSSAHNRKILGQGTSIGIALMPIRIRRSILMPIQIRIRLNDADSDPDPTFHFDADPHTDPAKMMSIRPDPDPQHCT